MFFDTNNKIYILECPSASKEDLSKLGHLIVQKAALCKLNIKESEFDLQKGTHGKPYLNGFPDFHFNISHSGKYVAAAFSSTDVGVDIEALRDINLKISHRHFTLKEQKFVCDCKTFFYVWTRKEAFIKERGTGFTTPFSSFDALDNKNIKTFETENYTVSVCSENAEKFELIILSELENLEKL